MPTVNAEDLTPTPTPEPGVAAAAPEAPASGPETGEELPDELLTAVPALQLLMNGSPPATVAPRDAGFPELKVVEKYIQDLGEAGFGLYPTKDEKSVVFFNGLYVTPEDVKAADEAGTLDSIAVPYEELRGAVGMQSETADEGSPSAPPSSAPAPANTPTKKKLATARTKNLTLGQPTSGPVPGQGRILNNILKPVV
jgi:hypothetical protein